MSRSRAVPDIIEFPDTIKFIDPHVQQFDWAIFGLLVGLLAFLPLAMGTHQAWNEAIALYAAAAVVVVLTIKLLIHAEQRFVWSWTYVPIAILVGFVLFQTMPLPAELVRSVSPSTAADRAKLFVDLPGNLSAQVRRYSISFYPFKTWHDLRNLLVTAAVFVVTVNLCRGTSKIKLLLWALAIIGSVEASLAIAQILTGASGIYWSFVLPGQMRPEAGTFPNHNFFSQFMNVSSGATLGLLLLTIDETFHRHDYTPAEVLEKLGSPAFRPAYLLVAMLSVNTASVFLSLSRGGVISILIAGLCTVVLLIVRGGRRGMGVAGWFAGLIVLFILVLVLAGGSELVEARLQRIGNRDDQYDRLRLTTDTVRMWQRYPLLGTGLGTFEYVFPRFDDSGTENVATHAEDEYVELLAELGLVGSACVATFGGMIAWAFLRARARGKRDAGEANSGTDVASENVLSRRGEVPAAASLTLRQSEKITAPGDGAEITGRRRRKHRKGKSRRKAGVSAASSLSIGIGFGLIAMLVQSLSDFAPHFLSVSCPAAALCGLLLNLASMRQQERGIAREAADEWPSDTLLQRRRILRGIALILLLVVSTVLIPQSWKSWSAESNWNRVKDEEKLVRNANWTNIEGHADDLNEFAADAVRADPENVFYQFWRGVYADYTFDRSRGPAERKTVITRMNDALQAARIQCPVFGPMVCQIGQWQQNDLDQWKDGAVAIRLALWLAPNNSTANFVAAGLDADEGDMPAAVERFKNAILLQPVVVGDVMDVLLDLYHRPDLLPVVAGSDISYLRLAIAKLRARDAAVAIQNSTADVGTIEPGIKPVTTLATTTASSTTVPATAPAITRNEAVAREAELIVDREIERMLAESDPTAATLAEAARLRVRQKRLVDALPYFDRALLLNYGNAQLRLDYATALDQTGQDDDALRQLRIIERQSSSGVDGRALSEQILVRRAMSNPNEVKLRTGVSTQR